MVDAYYDGPAGGFGDAIIVRESRAQRDGLFGGLVAVFVLAFIRGFAGAQTGAGRVAVTIFTSAVIALLVLGWIAIVSRRSRLEISRATISYVSKRHDRLVLSRDAGDRLRVVRLGSGRYRRPGLAIEGTDEVLPLGLFSVREVKRACRSKGWEFPGLWRPGRRVLLRQRTKWSGGDGMAQGAWSTVAMLLSNLWQATGHLLFAPPGLTVTALTVAVLAGVVTACLVSGAWLGRISAAIPLIGRAAALREKSWRAAFLRQRDPDAAGRPRPRAPSAAPAAA